MTSTHDPKTHANPMADQLPGPGTRPPLPPSQARDRPVRQLDAMVASLTTAAAPVLREIAARAAELAARAGEAAGPLAHKAAEMTEGVGGRVAGKGREIATDLRRVPAATTSPDDAALDRSAGSAMVEGDAGRAAWPAARAGSVVDPRRPAAPPATSLQQPRD